MKNIYIAFSIIGPRLDITVAFERVSEDLGYKVKVIYTDPSKAPQLIGVDKNGKIYIKDGTAYVDKDTGVNYILINSESPANRTKAGVIGTIAEEQSHIIGKIEGKQKVVPDGSEKGLESLGKPTNNYFKNEFSKNDKVIGIVSDGRDYSNVDFGENVGDNVIAAPLFSNPVTAIAGIVIIGYTLAPQDTKDKINQAIVNVYGKMKNQLYRLLDVKDEKELTISIIRNELLEQGIIADVTIDENTGKININEILSSKNSNGKKEGQVPQKRDDKKENINKNDKGSEDNKEPNNDEKKQTPKKSEDNFNKKTNPNASTNKTQSGKATLNEGKQGKHVVGHNNFQQGKSEVDMETARNVLNDFQDTGQKFFDENGQKLKEVVDTNGKYTGIFVDKDTGQRSITSRFTIHYDSKGTAHIVPANPNPK